MSTPYQDDVSFSEIGEVGIITLSRPKDLNAFTLQMIIILKTLLEDFSSRKSLVIMKSNVPKVFCSGGDVIRASYQAKRKNKICTYYPRYGYAGIYVIAKMTIPFVCLNDGLTMGGGVGFGLYSKYFVCTENTDLSMPEARIGHFPDVLTSYKFSRLENNLGVYLALTGSRMRGYDNVHAGIATHFCPASKLAQLEAALLEKPSEVEAVLQSFSAVPLNSKFSLEPYLQKINLIFGAKTVEGIIAALEADTTNWAKQTIAAIRKMCPLSLKATLRQLQLAKTMTLEQCAQNEYVLANTFFYGENFVEGVRARLIDGDNNPRWIPRTLEEVTPEMVDDLFNVKPYMGELVLLNKVKD